jgi:hypothetical protein
MSGGQGFTTGQGSVGHGGFSVALSGQAITVGQGTFEDQRGQAFFSSQGSLSGGITIRLSGQVITSAAGTLVYVPTTTGNLTIPLQAGLEATFSQQNVLVTPSQNLSGVAITSANGSVGQAADIALSGSAFSSLAGLVLADASVENTFIASGAGLVVNTRDVALTGSSFSATAGFVTESTANRDATLVPDGFSVAIPEAGDVTVDFEFALEGQEISVDQENVSAPGEAALVGIQISAEQDFLGQELALSGVSFTSDVGTLTAGQMSALSSGLISSASGFFEEAIGPKTAALSGQAISFSQGQFSHGTIWTTTQGSGTNWTPKSDPTSSWTEKDAPTTSWTKR